MHVQTDRPTDRQTDIQTDIQADVMAVRHFFPLKIKGFVQQFVYIMSVSDYSWLHAWLAGHRAECKCEKKGVNLNDI